MKKFEQKFGVIFFGILLSLSLSTLLVSCDDEDDDPNSNNSTTVSNNTVFTIYFSSYYDPINVAGELFCRASFATNLLTVVPTVTINNETFPKFYNLGGSLENSIDLTLTQVYNYSVSGGGNATTGTINLPEFVSSFTCNGAILSEEEMTQIAESNEYTINWQTVPCDYQIFYAYDGTYPIISELENDMTSYTLSEQDIGPTFNVTIYAFNGNKYTPGATPNATGNYGKGYIISESQSVRWIHVGTSATSQPNIIVPKELSHETKLKILVDRLDRGLQEE